MRTTAKEREVWAIQPRPYSSWSEAEDNLTRLALDYADLEKEKTMSTGRDENLNNRMEAKPTTQTKVTKGRIVRFHRMGVTPEDGEVAIVCRINANGSVNLAVFDEWGAHKGGIPHVTEKDGNVSFYWAWPPRD